MNRRATPARAAMRQKRGSDIAVIEICPRTKSPIHDGIRMTHMLESAGSHPTIMTVTRSGTAMTSLVRAMSQIVLEDLVRPNPTASHYRERPMCGSAVSPLTLTMERTLKARFLLIILSQAGQWVTSAGVVTWIRRIHDVQAIPAAAVALAIVLGLSALGLLRGCTHHGHRSSLQTPNGVFRSAWRRVFTMVESGFIHNHWLLLTPTTNFTTAFRSMLHLEPICHSRLRGIYGHHGTHDLRIMHFLAN